MFIKAPSPPLPPTDRGEETERGMVGGDGGGTPGLDNASLAILDGPSCGVSPNGDSLLPPPPCAAGKKGRLVLAERGGERGGGGPLGEGATGRRERECAEGERGKESRAAASSVYSIQRRKEGEGARGPSSSDEKESREGS